MGFLITSRMPGDPISTTSLALGAKSRNVTLRSACISGETGDIVGVLVIGRRTSLSEAVGGGDQAQSGES
jgi:hypothetical protein